MTMYGVASIHKASFTGLQISGTVRTFYMISFTSTLHLLLLATFPRARAQPHVQDSRLRYGDFLCSSESFPFRLCDT